MSEARVIKPARTTAELADLHRLGGLRAVYTQGAIDNDAALTDVYARQALELHRRIADLENELAIARAGQGAP